MPMLDHVKRFLHWLHDCIVQDAPQWVEDALFYEEVHPNGERHS